MPRDAIRRDAMKRDAVMRSWPEACLEGTLYRVTHYRVTTHRVAHYRVTPHPPSIAFLSDPSAGFSPSQILSNARLKSSPGIVPLLSWLMVTRVPAPGR
jgi:hypothetical protein